MLLSKKHVNQQTVVFYDFSGGLNTSASVESIGENQLSVSINMELDTATGCLRTVAGTTDVCLFAGFKLKGAAYDEINNRFILLDTVNNVYVSDLATHKLVGTLSGQLYPVCASWEYGLLIASGGKLQYYNGEELVTLEKSPDGCTCVYVRAGRVVVAIENEVHYSAVGDESDWEEDNNSESSSKWVEAGYKDGGKFIGMTSLASGIIIIKNNRRVYKLEGEYPDWSVSEISRNIECNGRMAFCSLSDSVLILGRNEVQSLAPTDTYGDIKPSNIASYVVKEIQSLPENSLVRYVPPLSQAWIIGSRGKVLMYDISHQAWFLRQFNGDVLDVVSVGDAVYVVKQDRISKLDENTLYDDGRPLLWKFVARRMVGQHDLFLKRTQVSFLPYFTTLCWGQVKVGGVTIELPVPSVFLYIYHNYSKIHKNRTKIRNSARTRGLYEQGDLIYDNPELIYMNQTLIYSRRNIIKESRNVFRARMMDVIGCGYGGGFVLKSITLDIVEV